MPFKHLVSGKESHVLIADHLAVDKREWTQNQGGRPGQVQAILIVGGPYLEDVQCLIGFFESMRKGKSKDCREQVVVP